MPRFASGFPALALAGLFLPDGLHLLALLTGFLADVILDASATMLRSVTLQGAEALGDVQSAPAM